MTQIPLAERLKRRTHRSVALAQDILLVAVYDSFPDCVLHGGTAIWRCYGGGRFSEDIDVYLPKHDESATLRFREGILGKGMEELKFKATENTVFGKFEFSGAVVSLEAALRRSPDHMVKPYEMSDGAFMLVNALSPDELVLEKATAYSSRRKVRDLYDIFFLLNVVDDRERVARKIHKMILDYRRPVDEGQLKATVIAGAVPSSEDMLEGMKRWVRQST